MYGKSVMSFEIYVVKVFALLCFFYSFPLWQPRDTDLDVGGRPAVHVVYFRFLLDR